MHKIITFFIGLSFLSLAFADVNVSSILANDRDKQIEVIRKYKESVLDLKFSVEILETELTGAKQNTGALYKTFKGCRSVVGITSGAFLAASAYFIAKGAISGGSIDNVRSIASNGVIGLAVGAIAGLCHLGVELNNDEIEEAQEKLDIAKTALIEEETKLDEEIDYLLTLIN